MNYFCKTCGETLEKKDTYFVGDDYFCKQHWMPRTVELLKERKREDTLGAMIIPAPAADVLICDVCGIRRREGEVTCAVCASMQEVIQTINKLNTPDPVNHPSHYTAHPSGVECIQITEHMNFCVGNAIKYLWRCELKGKCVEDLEKARFYIDREIERRRKLG